MNKILNGKAITNSILNKLSEIGQFESTASKFLRATEDEDIIKKLSIYFNDGYSTRIQDYLDSINPKEMGSYSLLEGLIPLMDSLNPHNKPDPYKDYFITKNGIGKELRHITQLNSLLVKSKDSKVIPLIERNQERGGIIVIGAKGSGKTLSQNKWLYDNNKILERNRILWVRLDASKLISIWKEAGNLNIPNLTTPEEYLFGQITYVFCKHFRRDLPKYSPLMGKIAQEISKSPLNIIPDTSKTKEQNRLFGSDFESLMHSAKKRGVNTIIEYLNELERQISIGERTFDGEYKRKDFKKKNDNIPGSDSFFVKNVLIASQQIEQDRNLGSKPQWVAMGKFIRDFIIQNNYYVLYIIDGLDNINFFFKEKNDYTQKLFKLLHEFPLKLHGTSKNELLMLSVRDTTFESLRRVLMDGGEHYDNTKYKKINNFYKIYIDTKSIVKPIIDKRLTHFFTRHPKYDRCFINDVLKTISDYHHIEDEARWNANIRCFLFNHLTLAKLITFRRFYFYVDGQSGFDIKQHIDTFENINFFLNGELFVNEQAENKNSNEGSNVFNLFGYTNYENKPLYLIYARILQTVILQPGISKGNLFNLLSTLKYAELDLEACIDRLISSGMLTSTYSHSSEFKLKYNVSPKGEFVLNSFLGDIHFLYYASLNTLLPQELVKSMKISPNNFTFDSNLNKRYYPPYCIITGFQFLQFLYCVHQKEISSLSDELQLIFSLPIKNDLLFSSINTMVLVCLKDEDYSHEIIDWFRLDDLELVDQIPK